ncbi:MAG: GNAT family N-acetyltransferase [bacterium]
MSEAGYDIVTVDARHAGSLQEFFATVGATRGIPESRWWWHARPRCCRIAVASATGEIAAVCGARPARLWVFGRIIESQFICEWYVSPSHSGHGLGRRLVSAIGESVPVLMTISISDSAAQGFQRLGWAPPTRVPIQATLSPLLIAARAVNRVRPSGVVVTQNTVRHGSYHYGDAFDDLWTRARPETACMAVRDAAELNWRLAAAPSRTYTLLTAHRMDKLVGYALTRLVPPGAIRSLPPWLPVGLLVDYLVDRNEPQVCEALVQEAARSLCRAGAHAVLGIAQCEPDQRAFARCGFVSGSSRLLGRLVSRLNTRFTTHWIEGTAPQEFRFTYADSDMDLSLGAA